MNNILLKAKKKLKRILKKKNSYIEDEFYQKLFIENKKWNTSAPNYDENLRWATIEKFLFFIKGYNSANSLHDKKNNILDVGCGRGWLSNLLMLYGNVIGIEPVKSVVEYGKNLFPSLDLRVGVPQDLLNKYTSHFDIIVCSEVIEHIPDEQKLSFLNNLKALLKPNGFLILTTPRKDAETEWKKYGDTAQPIEDWPFEETIAKLFSEIGFQKLLLKRLPMSPAKKAPLIDIYQLWLAQKHKL
ncbi:MAG TPA: methyltransferase domain-containing protein [Puia sp.]|jgi:2-polyprenyl-3-methyl-5-hydroxy-6-metoxy-1,4-benzoquinol methylase|nr:methyltransferase domain-containing protein [Puia sp.]